MLQLLCAWSGAVAFVASLAYFLFAYGVTFGETSPPGAWWRPALIDTGLFTIFALHHSLFARAGLKDVVRRTVSPVLERSVYTWIASLLFIGVCWAWQPVPGLLYTLPEPWHMVGYAVQAAGIALTFFGSRALDVFELAGVRQVLDARHPQPRGRVPLQTAGVYRLVRHPVYFAWLLLVFGAPHMTMTRFVFAVVSSLYLAVAIPFEERALVEAFGADYTRYRERVRWRMLPFVY